MKLSFFLDTNSPYIQWKLIYQFSKRGTLKTVLESLYTRLFINYKKIEVKGSLQKKQ